MKANQFFGDSKLFVLSSASVYLSSASVCLPVWKRFIMSPLIKNLFFKWSFHELLHSPSNFLDPNFRFATFIFSRHKSNGNKRRWGEIGRFSRHYWVILFLSFTFIFFVWKEINLRMKNHFSSFLHRRSRFHLYGRSWKAVVRKKIYLP